jgi:hypothetical protein
MRSDEEPRADQESEIGDDVPEADAIEQRQPAVAEDADAEGDPDAIPADAAEADALDQARSLPPEDETGR